MTLCDNCTYKTTCVARLIDTTLSGCDMQGYVGGTVLYKDFEVKRQFEMTTKLTQEG